MSEISQIDRPSRRPGRLFAWGLSGILLIVTARAFGWISFPSGEAGSPNPTVVSSLAASPPRAPENGPDGPRPGSRHAPDSAKENSLTDERIRQRIVGMWSRVYSGRWDLEIREDGTGTMTVVPDRLWAIVVGSKITIQMKWDVRDGIAIFDSVSGEPATSFEIVMKMWKKHQERRITELGDTRFVYLSDDGKSSSAWTRVTSEL